MMRKVTIIQTSTANTASVSAAFTRLSVQTSISLDPDQISCADYVVLPGVGSFEAAMQSFTQTCLMQVITERIKQDRPLLAICLGLQILGEGSEESPQTRGLGVLSSMAKRFDQGVIVPQMGWNKIQPDSGCIFLKPGYAYFANSYRLEEASPGWKTAWSTHGKRFVAGVERGCVLACQFHPELSGPWGRQLLERWLQGRGVSC